MTAKLTWSGRLMAGLAFFPGIRGPCQLPDDNAGWEDRQVSDDLAALAGEAYMHAPPSGSCCMKMTSGGIAPSSPWPISSSAPAHRGPTAIATTRTVA